MNLNRQLHNLDVSKRFCKPIPAVDISTGRFFLIADPRVSRVERIVRHVIVWSNAYGQSFREGAQVSDSWRIL